MKTSLDTMKKELLKCEYCGGTLVHDVAHVWCCAYCGKRTILCSQEDDAVTISLKIEYKENTYEIEMSNKCVIKVDYRRRVTAADPLPMFAEIQSSEDHLLLKPIKNIGAGTITLTTDVNLVKLSAQGKIKYQLTGPVDSGKYLDSGASIVLGPIGITIQ